MFGKKLSSVFLLILSAVLLSISDAYASPVTLDQARNAAKNFLTGQKLITEQEAPVGARYHYASRASDSLIVAQTRTIRGDEGQILAYISELEPEGYIIISADTNIRPVIGYSFTGKFPFLDSGDNALLHLVKWDMEARLKSFGNPSQVRKSLINTNVLKWENYSSVNFRSNSIAPRATWGPWIKTDWHQWSHFNDKVPYNYRNSPARGRRPVGCTATSIAQIINLHQYPESIFFDASDEYFENGIDIDNDASVYGFPPFTELNNALSTINYNGDTTEEAYLNFAAGVKAKMAYGIEVSGAWISAETYKDGLSYGSAEISSWHPWPAVRPKIIENLKKGMPVQVRLDDSTDPSVAHSVIVDGYSDTDSRFHVNLGWSPSDNIWYDLPNIQHYDTVSRVVYDIAFYRGWHQYGADEKNTFSTKYNAPTSNNIVNKWNVTPSQDYSKFAGLVVGYGNKIYATLSPKNWGSDSPGFWVINQYGDVEERHVIANDYSEAT